MVSKFKLQISKMIVKTFQSCRSKDPCNLPTHPVPSSHYRHVSPPRHKIYNSSASEYDAEEREERESEGLICSSSRSFSTEFSSLETIKEVSVLRSGKKKKEKRVVRRERRKVRVSVSSSEEGETPARLSVFLKLIPTCAVEGKVKESFAVIKKSEDPYEDFKRSMVEMILSKQMFEDRELEQLLQCFLSLNSRHYHGLIVQAFTEIWEAMFCRYSDSSSMNSIRVNH